MTFTDDYIDAHPTAFSALLSFTREISERLADGKSSPDLYERVRRMMEVLLALRRESELTAKQVECLENCLIGLADPTIPTIVPVYEVVEEVDLSNFMIGSLGNEGEEIGSVGNEGEGIPGQTNYP